MPQFHLSDKHCHDGSADTTIQAMIAKQFLQPIVFYGFCFLEVWLESCALAYLSAFKGKESNRGVPANQKCSDRCLQLYPR